MKCYQQVRGCAGLGRVLALALLAGSLAGASLAYAQNSSDYFSPGNLLVSSTVYDNNPKNVTVGEPLPPNCVVTSGSCSPPVTAINNGTYPYIFNNATVDGSFGITSKIILDQITPKGALVNSLEVPNSSQRGVPPTKDQMVSSFSSKSELALNLSTDHQYVTFMGYLTPIDTLDASNSNTPGAVDPTNPVGENIYRVVARLDQNGKFKFTKTNAYSGNNGRAAILNNSDSDNFLYTAGNAGNGGNPQPDGIILGAGAQIMDPQVKALVAQKPGPPTPVGSFNITQLGDTHDKIGKDTNFRGLTIFNNVLYTSKGSGGNGVNSVYFIDTTGTICTSMKGVGLPATPADLPTSPIDYDPMVLQTEGVVPYNMCILDGFPTALSSKTSFPFGIWFANKNTVYVADEGNGDNTFSPTTGLKGTYTVAAGQTTAGLQKWKFNSRKGTWRLAYTLQKGLNLGVPYTVRGYPTGTNPVTCKKNCPPWSPATDGLRNITGVVNGNGTATIYAITSTVSGSGDQGADPNKLVVITDTISGTTLPTSESFKTLRTAAFAEALRGVSFTPGT
ncbi:MAG: hypothetical protein JOZ29_09410 [Deltaproteobacteria bacterium]|nr:hypothetical protein [Deltaproteobacteria bacterium]